VTHLAVLSLRRGTAMTAPTLHRTRRTTTPSPTPSHSLPSIQTVSCVSSRLQKKGQTLSAFSLFFVFVAALVVETNSKMCHGHSVRNCMQYLWCECGGESASLWSAPNRERRFFPK
jgi:hypothetical protein